MPKGIGIIRWNNQLGPFLERSYPKEVSVNPQLVIHLYTSQTMGDIATPRLTSLSTDDLNIVSYFGGHQDPSILMIFLEKYESSQLFKKNLIDAFLSMPKEPAQLDYWLATTFKEFQRVLPLDKQQADFQRKLYQLLNEISEQNVFNLKAEYTYEAGISYPQLEGFLNLPSFEIGRLLERLANMGYLIREIQDSIPTCPDCNSSKLQLKWICKICNSSALEKTLVIEHYICGTKTIGDKFLTSSGGMKCPKCNVPLKSEGIDYGNLGIFHYCHKCKNFFNNPSKFLICHNCGLKFPEDNATLTLAIGYKLNQELMNKFKEHPEAFLLEEVNI